MGEVEVWQVTSSEEWHLIIFCVSPSGGVMLVHDIRRNKSHLIDFRESAPGALREEALQRSWETKVGTLVRRGSVSLYCPSANPSITLLNIYYGDKEKEKS